MKTKVTIALLSVLLFVSLGLSQPQNTRWEYRVEAGVAENRINSLAAQGWEVVTAGSYNGGMPYVILKRPK